jgi:hypothetical protein
VIILGFCFSGSFIDALSTPDSNRIIISSSGPDEFSYKGALEPDNIREGEFFVAEFFKSIAAGRSIKHSFSEAVIQTEIFTANADLSANSTEYFDNARQHPLLDDNGDGIGTNDIYESTGDGRKARDITIGVSPMSTNDYGDVAITQVAPTIFLAYTETSTDQIWAKVNESSKLLSLWYEVKPPDFESLVVAKAQMEMQLTRYTTEYDETSDSYQWDQAGSMNIFNTPGTYQIFYFAKDTKTKNVSPMMESRIYKDSPVNHPPEPFKLISPKDEEIITSRGFLASCDNYDEPACYTMISWEKTFDKDMNDTLTYTLFIKKIEKDVEPPAVIDFTKTDNLDRYEGLTSTFWIMNFPDDWEGSTVFWKVQAIDQYGAIRESEIFRFFINNKQNPTTGHLFGCVFNEVTRLPIDDVDVMINDYLEVTIDGGKFQYVGYPDDHYEIIIEMPGFERLIRTNIHIKETEKNVNRTSFTCEEKFYLKPSTPVISSIPSQSIKEGMNFLEIPLDQYIIDSNNEAHEMNWTFLGQKELLVSIDNARMAKILPPHENWHGSETITFTAEDPENYKAQASVTFTVEAVNDLPIMTASQNNLVYIENSDPINIVNNLAITDIDDQTLRSASIMLSPYHPETDHLICKIPEILDIQSTKVDDNYQLILVGNANHAIYETAIQSIQYSNSSNHPDTTPRHLTIKINDSKDDSLPFTGVIEIKAIDDPPHIVESMQPVTIDEDSKVIVIPLNNVFSDIDNADEAIEQTVSSDYDKTLVTARIEKNILSLEVLENQHGSTDITVIGTSNHATVEETFTLIVRPVNDPPEILYIPDQMIAEDGQFAEITLDHCVTDPDNTVDQMLWSVNGQSALNVNLKNRVASISPKDAEWNGVERIQFIAKDPQGMEDRHMASFTVYPLPDPPVMIEIPGQTIFNHSRFREIHLDDYVADPDNTDDEISWSFSGQKFLSVMLSNRIATIQTPGLNWSGRETIIFTATDPTGLLGFKATEFTVLNVILTYDFNKNSIIDLGDVIIVLQVLSGIHMNDLSIEMDHALSFEDLFIIMNELVER